MFYDTTTGEERTAFLWISELDKYLEDNPNLKQGVNPSPPALADSMRMGRQKPSSEFRERLRDMKKFYGSESTIRAD